jgi:hypothetical protein
MAIGKIETVVLNVKNVEKAVELYSELFDISFEPVHQYVLPGDIEVRDSFCPSFGLELIQQIRPPLDKEGVRAITIRVSNLEKAASKMKEKGIPLLRELKSERANVKESIYGMSGYLLILSQHDDF